MIRLKKNQYHQRDKATRTLNQDYSKKQNRFLQNMALDIIPMMKAKHNLEIKESQ